MAVVETPEVEFRAEARYVRTAPRKAQAVAAEIRGMTVGQARTALAFMTRGAARDVAGVLDSAIANAESHPTNSYDAESLYVSAAYVGSGPTLKRWQARARGRVGRIRKRTCHITIRVAPIPGATAVRPQQAAEQPRRARKPKAEAAAAAPAEVAAAEAAVAEEVAEQAPETPAVAEVSEEPSEEPAAVAVVEEPSEPVEKKPSRSRKAAAAPTEAPVADEAPAEAPTDVAEAEVEAPPAEDGPAEKPKRTRSTRSKAPEAQAEGEAGEPVAEAEKPKPRRTRKKTETAPEGEE
jgi:large subunit ribosomal protein L22